MFYLACTIQQKLAFKMWMKYIDQQRVKKELNEQAIQFHHGRLIRFA